MELKQEIKVLGQVEWNKGEGFPIVKYVCGECGNYCKEIVSFDSFVNDIGESVPLWFACAKCDSKYGLRLPNTLELITETTEFIE